MEIKSYKKKNGITAYMFRAYIGKVDGSSRYITRRGFETKGKARAALLQLQNDIENEEQTKKEITPISKPLEISKTISIQLWEIG